MMMFQTLARVMAPSATLKIRCDACEHQAVWTRREAYARCGPDATPPDIRRRVKCGACGAAGRARVWI